MKKNSQTDATKGNATATPVKITLEQAKRVLEVVDFGLTEGVGIPEPGKFCVEAAVCYALGQPHGDEPACVHPVVRSFKIALNDKQWSSNEARAKGMRRIAIAQLGSVDSLDVDKFRAVLAEQTIRKIVPKALRAVVKMPAKKDHAEKLEAAAVKCETMGTRDAALDAKRAAYAADADAAFDYADAADAADAAAYAANAGAYAAAAANAAANAANAAAANAAAANAAAANAARDEMLSLCAEIGVEALRAAGSPGVELMDQLIPLV